MPSWISGGCTHSPLLPDLLIVSGLNGLRSLSIGAILSLLSAAGLLNSPTPRGVVAVVECRVAAGRITVSVRSSDPSSLSSAFGPRGGLEKQL